MTSGLFKKISFRFRKISTCKPYLMNVSIRLLDGTSYMKPLSFRFLIFQCLNVYEVWCLNGTT